VLVVSHAGAIQLTAMTRTPGLAGIWSRDRSLDSCDTIEVEIDADGWRCPARHDERP
jgi:broad specificity phosphatase PhoE